jgi:aquaporin Z
MKKKEWKALAAECIGTALLLFGGLSAVVFDFGAASPVTDWVPNMLWRRVLTGFLFGSTGLLITLSPIGRISGAHLNPAVTLAFFGRRLMPWRGLLGYVLAQLVGAVLGAWVLAAVWGPTGWSQHEGVTVPGPSLQAAFVGEVVSTFLLVATILLFTAHNRLKPYTPYTIPVLFAILVGLEAPLSGCSANPARSFGPALITGIWTDHWLYWLAPFTGTALALLLFALPVLEWLRNDIAKLYHFGYDETGFLRGQEQPSGV